MTSTIETPITIPTPGPCPSWCEKPAGHWWNERNIHEMDDYGRSHGRQFGRFVEVWSGEVAGEPAEDPALSIEVVDLDNRADGIELIKNIQSALDVAFPKGDDDAPDQTAEFTRLVQAWHLGYQYALSYGPNEDPAVRAARGRGDGTVLMVIEGVQTVDVLSSTILNSEDAPGTHTLRDAELELHSAEAEVARRAGSPGNQLTAAWIRLGKAHAALAAAR